MKRFHAMDSRAAETAVETTLTSYHQNTITWVEWCSFITLLKFF